MKTQRTRFLLMGMAAIVVLAGLTGCPFLRSQEFIDDSYTDTRTFAPGDRLNVESAIGDVTVTTWDQNAVSVTYRKKINVFYQWISETPDPDTYFDLMGVVVETSANTPGLTVRDVMPVTIDNLYSPSIDLDIKMPANAILNITQGVGNVTVSGIHGALDMQVDVGDLEIHHPAPLAGESITTAVQIGDTSLYFPEGSAFDADAATHIGDIEADEFWSINIVSENITGDHATGRENGGGAAVTLDTQMGDIYFLREEAR